MAVKEIYAIYLTTGYLRPMVKISRRLEVPYMPSPDVPTEHGGFPFGRGLPQYIYSHQAYEICSLRRKYSVLGLLTAYIGTFRP